MQYTTLEKLSSRWEQNSASLCPSSQRNVQCTLICGHLCMVERIVAQCTFNVHWKMNVKRSGTYIAYNVRSTIQKCPQIMPAARDTKLQMDIEILF